METEKSKEDESEIILSPTGSYLLIIYNEFTAGMAQMLMCMKWSLVNRDYTYAKYIFKQTVGVLNISVLQCFVRLQMCRGCNSECKNIDKNHIVPTKKTNQVK